VYGIGLPSYITHRHLPTYQPTLKSDEKPFRRSHLNFLPSSKSRDNNQDRHQKSGPINFRYCPLVKESSVICQLPLKMAEKIDFENFLTFNSMWPWPSIGPYGIPLCSTHRPPTYTPTFIRIGETFCGRTDVRMDRHRGRLY